MAIEAPRSYIAPSGRARPIRRRRIPGERLLEVKAELGHGRFCRWLEAEFQWSESSAVKMMQVARTFKDVTVTDLGIGAKALYLLAAPSTPEPIREKFVEQAKAGQPVTHAEEKQVDQATAIGGEP